jgi:hypothetical protein
LVCFLVDDSDDSLLYLHWELPVASTHQLVQFLLLIETEQSDRQALFPVVDGASADLPGDDNVNLVII